MIWNIIVIIASAISISCLIYSEIQLRQCEKLLDEINKMIDEQKQECFKGINEAIEAQMKELCKER